MTHDQVLVSQKNIRKVTEALLTFDLRSPDPDMDLPPVILRDELKQALCILSEKRTHIFSAINEVVIQMQSGVVRPYFPVKDETSLIGHAAGQIRNMIYEYANLIEQIMEVSQAYSVGDLSVHFPPMPGERGKITRSMEGIRLNLVRLSTELLDLIAQAKKGRFEVVANAEGYKGEFARIIEGVNELFSTLIEPFQQLHEAIEQINHATLREHLNQDIDLPQADGMIGQAMDDLSRVFQRLRHTAFYDPVTGVPNRFFAAEYLDRILQRQSEGIHAVFILDLYGFSRIHGGMTNAIGDRCLVECTQRLQSILPEDAWVARFGGDQFVVVKENIPTIEQTREMAEQLLENGRQPYTIDAHQFSVPFAIGIALFPKDGTNAETLFQKADVALIEALREGGNNFRFHSHDISSRLVREITLESALADATDRDEIDVYYQPFWDVRNQRVCGMEALVRWKHEGKMLNPGEFLLIAEHTGLIQSIGMRVLEKACAYLKQCHQRGLGHLSVSINLSRRQLEDPGLIQSVMQILDRNSINPARVIFEVTESILFDDRVVDYLNQFKDYGFRIAIDDFGTGYSALSYLYRLPCDIIKIPREFLENLPEDKIKCAIAEAVITLGQTMKLDVIVEGVEKSSQSYFFAARSCYYQQGFLFSKPLPINAMSQFLDQHYR